MNRALFGRQQDQYQFRDISGLVQQAVDDLHDSQLIHNETFTLWEAMSACEIMDPRMDSGMILDSEVQQPEFRLYARLLPEEILWIMDRTFECEMSWHAGNSLAQTIFTCMYLHQIIDLTQHNFEAFHQAYPVRHHGVETHINGGTPNDPPGEFVHLVLKAYLVGLLRCCYHVWEEMSKGNLYEEEDFVTHRFGLSLLDDISDSTVLNLLDDAEYWLSTAGTDWMTSRNMQSTCKALSVRIRLRKSFLLAFEYLEEPLCEDYPKAVRQLQECQKILSENGSNAITTTATLGRPVKGVFDFNIIRKLASQAPPRPIETYKTEEAAVKLDAFLKQSLRMCQVLECKHPDSMMTFLSFFAFEQPPCFPYTRSKLQTTVINENRVMGKQSVHHLIQESIAHFSNPPSAVFYGDGKGGSQDHLQAFVSDFIKQVSRPYIDTIKILCHNRARQQRMLAKVLGEWELAQGDAETVDAQVHMILGFEPLRSDGQVAQYPYLLSSWVYHMKFLVMEQVLLLGFELDLYQPHEFRMIYWYLVYILELHNGHIERTAMMVNAYGTQALDKVGPTTARGKEIQVDIRRAFAKLTYHQNRNSAHLHLCEGMYKLLSALPMIGIPISQQSLEYDDERARYERRFKSMRLLASPPMLAYEDYQASKHKPQERERLLTGAQERFDACKSVLSDMMVHIVQDDDDSPAELCKAQVEHEMQELMKTCIDNGLAVKKAIEKMKVEAGPTSSLHFDTKYHPWYPIIVLE